MEEKNTSRTLQWLVWTGLALVIVGIAMAFVRSRIHPHIELPVYGHVAAFSLTNQNSERVTLDDLRGKVWIADIVFTRCAGPCPEMTRKMSELQSALPAHLPVKLVTLTTDPEYDTPPVLKRYAEKFAADTARWSFLTGTPMDIYKLAVESLKLTAIEKEPSERETPIDLFVHSTIFVLVDKRGQLRGVYQTTGSVTEEGNTVDWSKTKQELIAAARSLTRE